MVEEGKGMEYRDRREGKNWRTIKVRDNRKNGKL